MQSIATPRVTPSAVPQRPGPLSRLWSLSLGWHAVALLCLLLGTMLLTTPGRLAHADEGAALSQTQLLLDGEGWSVTHPLPAADPEGHAFPIGGSTQREGTQEFVPFSKHPVYPVLLTPFVAAFGVAGGALLSVLGTTIAAIGTALLTRRLDPSLDRAALWFFGLATPMWFNSFITIAHPLGAAAVVFAVWFLLRSEPRAVPVAAGSLLLTLGVLLRNEAILLGVSFAVALAVAGLVRRELRWLVVSASAFAGTAVGYVLDARLASMTLGGDEVDGFTIEQTGSFVSERFSGFSFTVLAPSDGTATGLLLSMLGVVFVIAAAVTIRRRPTETSGMFVFLGGAVLVEALRWVVEPAAYIPGLVFAAPLLVAGLLLLDGKTVARREIAILVASSALFFCAVVATQYSNGGGGGWGGRYFSIALPLIVPVAVFALARAGATVPRSARTVLVSLCVAISGILVLSQSTSLATDHRLNRSFEQVVQEATNGLDAGDGDPRPVVVTTRRGLGRMAYRTVLDQRWLEVPEDDEDVAPYVTRLHDLGIERFVLVTAEPDEVLPTISSQYVPVNELMARTTDVFGRDIFIASRVIVLEAVNRS